MIENKWYDEKEVEALYPQAIMVPPMKIGSFPGTRGITLEEVCTNGEYFAQYKKDGGFYTFHKAQDYSYLFGRTESKKTGLLTEKGANVPHIMKTLADILPPNTMIAGEIYYPGGSSKDMTTIMGCLPQKAIERQLKKGYIHYYIHDVLMWNGEDLLRKNARERYNYLLNIDKNNLPNYIEIADLYEDCNLLTLASEALAAGEEGIVMKRKDSKYEPGLRPAWQTIKIKKHDTVDVVCMGFEDPEKEYTGKELDSWGFNIRKEDENRLQGKYKSLLEKGYNPIPVTKPYYYGWKAAIEIGVYKKGVLVPIGTVSSGLGDFEREDFSKNPDKYLGKTIEVSIMEKGDGTLRHPVFERFRDDKDPLECTYESIFK